MEIGLCQSDPDGQNRRAFNARALDPIGRWTVAFLVQNMPGWRWRCYGRQRGQDRHGGELREYHGVRIPCAKMAY
jgi:hypothetical protein